MDTLIFASAGAIISALISGIGSSIGILTASSKGSGVLAEKSHLFGKILILTALPGSQGVYGLLIAILILLKAGVFEETDKVLSLASSIQLLAAGILMAFAAFSSALLQGKAIAASIGAVARNEDLAGKAIVMSVLIETYAIFGLLVSLLIANSVQLSAPVVAA